MVRCVAAERLAELALASSRLLPNGTFRDAVLLIADACLRVPSFAACFLMGALGWVESAV